MILEKKQLEKIKNFSKKNIKNNDPWHRISHIEQTVKISIALAKKEKADINKCIVSAWLHDIAKNKEKQKINHGNAAAKIAKKFLKEIKISNKDIEDICYAIQQHNKGEKKKTKEAQILWDADKLQAIGPYGLLRCYDAYAYKKTNQEESLQESIKDQNFFIKRFQTKTGKKIARKNYKFMKKFYKKYKQISEAKF